MKKPIQATLTLFFAFIGFINAQITIDSTDFATYNDTVIQAVDSFPSINVTSGANQMWDFSSLAIQTYDTLFFKDTVGSAGNQYFPTSNMVVENSIQNLFVTASSSGVEINGFYGDPFGVGTDLDVVFNPSMSLITFPANYNDVDNDVAYAWKGFSGAELGVQQLYDSVSFERTVTSEITFDGYGTVTLPSGSYTVLKSYTREITEDKVRGKSQFIGWSDIPASLLAGFGFDSNPRVDTAYVHRWYAKQGKYAICEARFDSLNSTVPMSVNFILGEQVVGAVVYETNASCGISCNGSAEVVGIGGTAPISYLWSNGTTTANANGLCPGQYFVTVSDANNTSNVVEVNINESPTFWNASTNQTYVSCSGCSDGELTATSTGGSAPFTYQWDNGQTTATITGLSEGQYSVTVTDANQCSASTSTTVVVDPFLSIEGKIKSNTLVYPNPANNQLNISSNEYIVKVEFVNLIGKKVITTNSKQIDVSKLSEGIYFLNIYKKEGVETKKITIKK